jgi:hypothetical protein
MPPLLTQTNFDHPVPARVDPTKLHLKRSRGTKVSYVLVTFALLICTDLMARVSFPLWKLDRYNSPNRSWIWWALKDFRAQKQRPEIVLLGSSLMALAVHGGDAQDLGVPQNNVLHHRSALLERLLLASTRKACSVFSLAIGGQMASDAFCITSTILKGKSAPFCIIYGIAPRDLMDNTLPSPASTETFKYLSRSEDLSSIAMQARSSAWDRLEYWFSQVCFLYAHKADLVYLQHHYAQVLFKRLRLWPDLELVKSPMDLRKIAMFELPDDIGPNESFTSTSLEVHTDNTAEYRSRYAHLDKRQFADQESYLRGLMQISRDRNIRLVLVNMPVAECNIRLMPKNFYRFYLNSLQRLCHDNNVAFLDLHKPRLFTDDCFLDSVHLNGKGAVKYFQLLVKELVGHNYLPEIRSTRIAQ